MYVIYFLQDTHLTFGEEKYVRSIRDDDVILNCHSSQARGVALLLDCNVEYKIHHVYKDGSGNFLFIDITLNGNRMSVGTTYGPNTDTPDLYKTKFKEYGNSSYILGEDFNLVLDPDKDTNNYKNINNPNAREQLLELIAELNLIYIWREKNQDSRQYTWRRSNPIKQARLDFFHVCENLCSKVTNVKINA